jgi:hypothetical protein
MAKKKGSGPYTEEEYKESVDPAFKALLLQQVAIRGNDENPHEILNDLLKKQRTKRLYSQGKTRPTSALALHLEAERDIKHSSKLWRNMKNDAKTNNQTVQKNSGDESHHVVASRDPRAQASRRVIFSVGIGVNDVRNGVNLQRALHRPIHTTEYFAEVDRRLLLAEQQSRRQNPAGRETRIGDELMDMADEIENGIF